jgi:hypothetical protein
MKDATMRVDGNAMGGTLSEVFAREVTSAQMTCDGCGAVEPLGAEHAYLQAPGMVLRCCHCEQVLLVVTRANEAYLLSFRGVRWFELPAEP